MISLILRLSATLAVAFCTPVEASNDASRKVQAASVLLGGLYEPTFDVTDVAAIDLDQRTMTGRFALDTEDGMDQAQTVYSAGSSDSAGLLTLQSLSTNMQEKLFDCDNVCAPYPTYQKFVDYFGEYDYANQWILAAFDGASTTSFKTGGVDFSSFGLEGRSAAIKWATVVMNAWMYVSSNMESAIRNCKTDCGTSCDTGPLRAWDQAVAMYTGSEASGDHGYLLHTMAQTECKDFGTCATDGLAAVNRQVFDNFVAGQQSLQQGKCGEVVQNVERITALMTVPLIQGVLRSAYALDLQGDNQQITQGEAAAFAASILPLVSSCSGPIADIVFKDLAPGNAVKSSYEVIKANLERTYVCLQITCADVGGLVDPISDGYLKGAEACTSTPLNSVSSSSNDNSAKGASSKRGARIDLALGLTTGLIAALLIVVGIKVKTRRKEFDTAAESVACKLDETQEATELNFEIS